MTAIATTEGMAGSPVLCDDFPLAAASDTPLGDAIIAKLGDSSKGPDSRLDSYNVTPQGELEASELESGKCGVAGDVEATCAIHGKKRSVAFLQLQSDGKYTCLPPNTCKLPRLPNVTSPLRTETDGGATPPLTAATTVTCSVHGKNRSARNMVRVSDTEWRCQSHMQCRMERGPGRYVGEGTSLASHPSSLARNTSSNMSFGSDPNLEIYLRSPQSQHFQTTPPVTTMQYSPQHSVIYLSPSSPQIQSLGPGPASGYIGAQQPQMMSSASPNPMAMGTQPHPLQQSHSSPTLSQPSHLFQFAPGQPMSLPQAPSPPNQSGVAQYVLVPQSNGQPSQSAPLVMSPQGGTVVMTNAAGQVYTMQSPSYVQNPAPHPGLYNSSSAPQLVSGTSSQLYHVMYTQPVQYRPH